VTDEDFAQQIRQVVQDLLPDYDQPFLIVTASDQIIGIDPGEPIEAEDEERLLETVLQGQGLAFPGVIGICRHPTSGFRVIRIEEDGFEFYRLDPDGPELMQEATPDFWACRVTLEPGTPTTAA